MEIIYHHRTQGRGAEGVHIREVVNALRKAGHHVDVVSPSGVDPFNAENIVSTNTSKKTFRQKVLRVMPQFLFECLEVFYNVYAFLKVGSALKSRKVDFYYERYAFFCISGVKRAKKLNIPIVLEVNEISGIERQRGQCFVGLCARFERKIFSIADSLIVVSEFLKNELVKRGVDSSKITVMPNAVNEEDFILKDDSDLRVRLNLENKVVISFVGIFARWDRLESLIKVFARLKKDYDDIHLVLVGDGEERESLESLVAEEGILDAVTFTGRISRREVIDYLQCSDITTLAGSNNFGSPIALFEYMIMKTCVCVPNHSPISAIVKHEETGLVFERDDDEQYYQNLKRAIDEQALRQTLGENARVQVLENHLWSRNVEQVLNIVKECV